ncbi:hypothetical protein SAY87_008066 [Trapa incisa]|uniref:Aluminum-activated malate transporter n=1 Tax=Trapa incisa TaxID=236973 RepID=A0AAN7KJM5_9MYRT|nr:hypothetical protein SAY87_008066 [Trapa incisa]
MQVHEPVFPPTSLFPSPSFKLATSAMDIESSSGPAQGGARAGGALARIWGRVKGVPVVAKDKAVEFATRVRKLGQDDPRRVIHSLKVGLALTLVSLVYYVRPFYDGYGISGIWAVVTVVVVFEFTVGATLSKGINRGCATLLAGALGIGSQYLACLFGKQGEAIVLASLVFLLGATATFTRFFPRIKARYDYGVLIFILTYSMVAISGYRVHELIQLAHQRLTTILIGGATCVFVAIFVCPVWAGEDLHSLIAGNIDKLADFLEAFGGEYFQCFDEINEKSKTDKTCLQRYKTVLTSKNIEESWANWARWEPAHGRFRYRHPWKQYLKIGALARQCAYQIATIHGYVCSDAQVPCAFKRIIEAPSMKVSSEASKALRTCASAIKQMAEPSCASLYVENAKSAVEELKAALGAAQLDDSVDLLEIVPAATVASVLIGIVDRVEEVCEEVIELAKMAHFKAPEKQQQQQMLHRGAVKPVVEGGGETVSVVVDVPALADRAECCTKTTEANSRASRPDTDPPMK